VKETMRIHSFSRKPPVDLNQSAVSRYLQLATLFRRRVDTGEWAVGARIPTVDDLAKECGVARLTSRQALGQLEPRHIPRRPHPPLESARRPPIRLYRRGAETRWRAADSATPRSD